MTLLITGFEAFGGWSANPTAELAPAVAQRFGLPHAVLAVDLEEAPRALQALREQHRPALSLHLGLSGQATAVTLERAALNVVDFRIADVAGRQPRRGRIVQGGPDGLMTRVDLLSLQAAVEGTVISNSAGTYLCNALYYHALLESAGRALFVHVPPTPGLQAPSSGTEHDLPGGSAMALSDQMRAVEAIARYLLATLEPAS